MSWTERVYQYDGQGNTCALVDETSTVTDTFTYDAWGNEVARTGTTKTPFRWNGGVGYYWDENAGTYQVRRRPYVPSLSRFLSIDPLNVADSYFYAANNCINIFDPTGLKAQTIPCSDPCKRGGGAYIPNRGDFDTLVLRGVPSTDPLWPGYLNSKLVASWQAYRGAFLGKKKLSWGSSLDRTLLNEDCCCCCNEVAFIQIARLRVVPKDPGLWGNGGWRALRATFRQGDWFHDSGLWFGYGYNNYVLDPCMKNNLGTYSAGNTRMEDTPGYFSSSSIQGTTATLVQEFETCVFCRSGIEEHAIYGCFKWGHAFHRTSSGEYDMTRTLNVIGGIEITNMLFDRPEADIRLQTSSIIRHNVHGGPPSARMQNELKHKTGPFDSFRSNPFT